MQINVYYKENQMITIDMEDFTEYIAIYNRYLSEKSIYDNNKIGIKNIYALTTRNNGLYYYTNYQNEDNYFIDISIDYQSTQTDEFAKNIIQEKIIKIDKEIEKIKQKVLENANNFYVLNYYISIYTGKEFSTGEIYTSCYLKGNTYEMTVHDFKENIEPIIIDYARQEEGGGIPDYIYDFSDVLGIDAQNTTEYYNPDTGEKIVL